jgi:hypothetical protein
MNEEKIHLRRRTWSLKSSPVIAAGLVLILATAQAQQAGTPAASEDESAATNAANNPTTPKLTFEAQDYWMPSVSGLGGRGGSNGLQRNIVPIQTFGFWNLFHVIVPVDTNPNSPGGTLTGLGGLQLYNLSTVKLRGTTYGAGRLVVLPTESAPTSALRNGRPVSEGLRSMPQSGDFWADSSPISTPSGKAQARSRRRRHSSLLSTTTSTMDCIFEARVCWSSTPAPELKTFLWGWASARYGTLPAARPSTSIWSPSIRCGEADLGHGFIEKQLRNQGYSCLPTTRDLALRRGAESQLSISRPGTPRSSGLDHSALHYPFMAVRSIPIFGISVLLVETEGTE